MMRAALDGTGLCLDRTTGHSVYKTSHPEFSEKEVSTSREAYEALAEPILLCRKG